VARLRRPEGLELFDAPAVVAPCPLQILEWRFHSTLFLACDGRLLQIELALDASACASLWAERGWVYYTEACGGLGSTPDRRTRRAHLHLS